MPLRLNMEYHVLSQRQRYCLTTECPLTPPRRLPGLPNSYTGLETMLGIDEDLDVEDVLNGASPVTHTLCPYSPDRPYQTPLCRRSAWTSTPRWRSSSLAELCKATPFCHLTRCLSTSLT